MGDLNRLALNEERDHDWFADRLTLARKPVNLTKCICAPGVDVGSAVAVSLTLADARGAIHRVDAVAARGDDDSVVVTGCDAEHLLVQEGRKLVEYLAFFRPCVVLTI